MLASIADAVGDVNAISPTVSESVIIETPTLTLTNTSTIEPSTTLTPTITLTPEKPMVTVSENTNCRTGPGKNFDYVGALMIGELAEVVGQSMDGEYWVIENPDREGLCWLWGYYAYVTGPTANLPIYPSPPTPTPEIDWLGTWTTFNGAPGGPYETISIINNQLNSSINGSFNFGGESYSLNGSLSTDKKPCRAHLIVVRLVAPLYGIGLI